MPKLQPAGLDFLETAPLRFSTEVDIAGDIDLVWSVITDNSTWVEWFENCGYVTSDDDEWTEVGQHRTIKSTPFVIDETLIAIDAPHRWVIELTRSNVPMANRMVEVLELTDTSRNGEDRTGVRWTAAVEPLWYLAPFARVNEYLMIRTWGRSLEALHGAVASRLP